MKILYISQYFPPEMGAPAARAVELARHWAAAGHHVTVLTGFPNHPTGVVPLEYRGKLPPLGGSREKLTESMWFAPASAFSQPKGVRADVELQFVLPISREYRTFLPRPDVVIATSPQLLVALSGWWLALCKRVPFVFEVRDLWPESLAAVGMATKFDAAPRPRASRRISISPR